MTTIDHPDFSQPVNFDTMQLPDSGEGQVSGTIAMMRRYAVQDSKHPALVQQLNARLQGCMDVQDALQRIFDQAKQSMYFQRDEATGDWLAPDVVEVLVRPADVALLTQQPDSQPVPGIAIVSQCILRPCFSTSGCRALLLRCRLTRLRPISLVMFMWWRSLMSLMRER